MSFFDCLFLSPVGEKKIIIKKLLVTALYSYLNFMNTRSEDVSVNISVYGSARTHTDHQPPARTNTVLPP